MSRNKFIANLWRWSAGKPEKILDENSPHKFPTYKEIMKSQWSNEFESLMRNRLAMGYFRYGPLKEQPKGKYDVVGSAIKRLQRYKEEGNDELLVDVANLCLVEFLKGVHPNKHFVSEDDTDHAAETKFFIKTKKLNKDFSNYTWREDSGNNN